MNASALLELMDRAIGAGSAPTRTTPPAERPRINPAPKPVADPATAERLRELADKLQEQIDHKRAPLSQNWTPRRARIKDSMEADADRLECVQRALRGLADMHDAGNVPPELQGIRTRAAVERGLGYTWDDKTKTPDATRAKLKELASVEHARAARAEREAKREREARLRTSNRPGFFPTPDALADRMMMHADTGRGDRVLEPSAGLGALVARARATGADVVAVEIAPDIAAECREITGHPVECGDFLAMTLADLGGEPFDAVVMNPPFENGAAWKHARHAWDMLRPGGRLVLLAPAGGDTPGWLAEYADLEEEHADAFKGAQAFRSTGVRVRIIVAEKP